MIGTITAYQIKLETRKFSKPNLLICPSCWKNGDKQILGECIGEGTVDVLRFHQHTTRIIGGDFTIECGQCGEPVYIRLGANHGSAN